MVNFVNWTGPQGTQMFGKILFLHMSVKMFLDEKFESVDGVKQIALLIVVVPHRID